MQWHSGAVSVRAASGMWGLEGSVPLVKGRMMALVLLESD